MQLRSSAAAHCGCCSGSSSSSRLPDAFIIRPSTSSSAAAPSLRRRVISSSSSSGSSAADNLNDEDRIWQQLAFPSYLQSRNKHRPEVCREFDQAVTAAERKQAREVFGIMASSSSSFEEDDEDELEPETVWHTIRREAERDAAAEPLLSSFLYASILAHDTFQRALAFVLSNRLANAVMLPTQLFEIFHEVLVREPDVREGALADVEACRERDPACTSYSQALLYYKGYHAIQTHRIAHALWARGQKVMAVALQSRMSEVLAVDIHPAARFGRGILLDHGTGVVIGETAVIGNNVSLLQNVTLGGTGKDHGDRHPKISDNVLIGACATVLGNISVGEGAQIAAGSLVLKPVAPHTMVAGSPAKQVGHVTGNPAEKMQQWSKKLLTWDPFAEPQRQPQQPQQQSTAPTAAAAASTAQPQPAHTGGNGAAAPAAAAAAAEPSSSSSLKSSSSAAAAGGNGAAASSSSSSSRPRMPKPTRATIAAAEAKWDAIAARISAAGGLTAGGATANGSSSSMISTRNWIGAGVPANGSSSSSSGLRVVNGTGSSAVNGTARNGANGSSKPSVVAGHSSGTILPKQQQQESLHKSVDLDQQQQHIDVHSVAQQQHVQQSGAQAKSAAVDGATGQELQSAAAAAAAGRKKAAADLQGLHEGDVEATLDEEVAAEKWASRKEEPEYVI